MKVALPTGGDIQYIQGAGMEGSPSSGAWLNSRIYRRVRSRTVRDGVGGPPQTTLFSQEKSTDPQLIIDETYMDGSARGATEAALLLQGQSGSWKIGREEKTAVYDETFVLQRQVEHEWAQRAPLGWCHNQSECPPNDPRIIRTDTRLESGLVSRQEFEYDRYNNTTRIREYDFGVGVPGLLLRDTRREYLTANGRGVYDSIPVHVRNALSLETVLGRDGSVASQTCYEYDEGALLDRPGITGHTSGLGLDYIERGNLTTMRRARLGNSCDLTVASHAYDIAGNVVESTDANGNTTQFSYEDRFGSADGEAESNAGGPPGPTFAFATRTTNPLGHIETTQYDYHSGQPVDAADVTMS
jgi:hypothetical protein